MKVGVRVDKAAIDRKFEQAKEDIEEKIKEKLEGIAKSVTDRSPVDTGAFVTSFSLKNSYSSGRGRSSRGKPRKQNPATMRAQGYDIRVLEPLEQPLIVLSNGAPHASYINNVYSILSQVKDINR